LTNVQSADLMENYVKIVSGDLVMEFVAVIVDLTLLSLNYADAMHSLLESYAVDMDGKNLNDMLAILHYFVD